MQLFLEKRFFYKLKPRPLRRGFSFSLDISREIRYIGDRGIRFLRERSTPMTEHNRGWIPLSRSIQQHWLWQDQPFSMGQAWLDLMLTACYTPKKMLLSYPKMVLELPRGGLYTSQVQLAERWGWSRTKVRSFLAMLQKEGMLQAERVGNGYLYTLLCYEEWTDGGSTTRTDASAQQAEQTFSTHSSDASPHSTEQTFSAQSEDTPSAPMEFPAVPRSGGTSLPAALPKDSTGTADAQSQNSTGTLPAPYGNTSRTPSRHIQQREERKQSEQGKPPQPPRRREQAASLPDWTGMLPVVVVDAELSALLMAGADRPLVEWAAAVAAERGKGWAYAQGIIRKVMQEKALTGSNRPYNQTSAPIRERKPSSYDPEEFDRRGFDLPPLPSPPDVEGPS